MSIITLTTDYGLKDHFVGALKGKILSQDSEAKIVDISHDVDPFNVSEASYIIGSAYNSFPKGTVHIVGIDIELRENNQHIAIEWNGHFFIAADNGILSMLIEKIKPQKMVVINIHDRLLPEATDMDVLLTVAIHISKGGSLSVIGKEIKTLKEVTELQPVVSDDTNSIKGYIVYLDRFGNAVTNITRKMFLDVSKGRPYEVNFKSKKIKSIFAKYSDLEAIDKRPLSSISGNAVAIFNESGFLEIGLYKSNPKVATAASLLGITYRDAITINFN
ncbi:S-adenosyl-l-methionine hydroxide adenosyltransferase family protein [Flavobacterium sp.]|jgi:S-adenosylmethionine hydrolase|uniref:S-adenosyl-l-methionine hydroxide adenosyltransferase family protein n=1 Tax=Flavobacterium sp. TaxID=239 RepID=UPI0037BE2AC8